MRKRINRACVASSSNYAQSKKVHKQMLEENHSENAKLFLMISTPTTPKPLTSLEQFEESLKRDIENFKSRRV